MSNAQSATKTVHARIDRGTHHVVLPIVKGQSLFSIRGRWGDDDYGPDATLVSLTCRTRKASRNSEHRLTRDTEFALPADTESIELRVHMSCPGTALTATVTTTLPQPRKHSRRAVDIHRRVELAAQANAQ